MNLIGYVLIEDFVTEIEKVCESPKHLGMNIPAFAVLVIKGESYPDGLVQIICEECWDHFDKDMNHPKWNLLD